MDQVSNTRRDIIDIIKAGVELPPGVILFETRRGRMNSEDPTTLGA